MEALFVDPQEGPRLVGFAFVFYGGKAVPPLAMVSLVVVVELDLPDGFEGADVCELGARRNQFSLLNKAVFTVTVLGN